MFTIPEGVGCVLFSIREQRLYHIPSGNLLHSHIAIEKGPIEIVDFPRANCDFPWLCKRLPEGKSHKIPLNHHFPMVLLCFFYGFPEGTLCLGWASHTVSPPRSDLPMLGRPHGELSSHGGFQWVSYKVGTPKDS